MKFLVKIKSIRFKTVFNFEYQNSTQHALYVVKQKELLFEKHYIQSIISTKSKNTFF